jgi:prepilin-type N-terminal cleavage/methylation domain-containing protein
MVRPSSKTSAFTLIEALMVVAIIGILAAATGPAMYQALAERRAAEASIDLVRVTRRARSEAAAYGRAHLMRWQSSSDGGSFEVFRGISSSCIANDWATIIAAGACDATPTMCVDRLDLASSRYDTGTVDVRANEVASSATFIDLCFEPTGRTLHRTTATGTFTDSNTINGGYVFRFQRYDSAGNVEGVARRVVIPLGGDARVLR